MEGASNNTALTDTFHFYFAAHKINFCASSYRNVPQVRSNGLEKAKFQPYEPKLKDKNREGKVSAKTSQTQQEFFLHSLYSVVTNYTVSYNN